MKKGGGKRKGSAYERDRARALSLWLTDGKSSTELIRSVSSGGWQSRADRQAGDLAANGEVGAQFRDVFVVECKHRDADLFYRIRQNPSEDNLQGWWKKTAAEALRSDAVPMVLFKQQRRVDMVCLPVDFGLHYAAGPYLRIVHSADLKFDVLSWAQLVSRPAEELLRLGKRWREGGL